MKYWHGQYCRFASRYTIYISRLLKRNTLFKSNDKFLLYSFICNLQKIKQRSFFLRFSTKETNNFIRNTHNLSQMAWNACIRSTFYERPIFFLSLKPIYMLSFSFLLFQEGLNSLCLFPTRQFSAFCCLVSNIFFLLFRNILIQLFLSFAGEFSILISIPLEIIFSTLFFSFFPSVFFPLISINVCE